MAIYAYTKRPKRLLSLLKAAVDDGRISTWSYDNDGDFTHTGDQWARKAWLRPIVEEHERIVFCVVPPKGKSVSSVVYAVYHGRFAELLLRHFDQDFDRVSLSALPSSKDQVK